MKLGITGADGFVAWHLRSYLHSLGSESVKEVRLADRSIFAEQKQLEKFVAGLNGIVHLAGVNRASEQELIDGNILPAQMLADALTAVGSSCPVIFASSLHAVEAKTTYGKGKKQAAQILRDWAKSTGNRYINLIIPHVFGEYCRPFYNSAIASFCLQILNNETLEVNPDGLLELVHVQELAEQIVSVFFNEVTGDCQIEGQHISVSDVVGKLNRFYDEYITGMRIPDLSDGFTRNLFNTFRSYIDNSKRNIFPPLRTDDRGWLVETVKACSGGQCFVSSTHPGIVRGNHFHRRKVERFFVLQGEAEIKIRKLLTNDVQTYRLSGEQPSFIDIPTLHTHSIKNIGEIELITLFWADEFFDPENSDTYFEEVE